MPRTSVDKPAPRSTGRAGLVAGLGLMLLCGLGVAVAQTPAPRSVSAVAQADALTQAPITSPTNAQSGTQAPPVSKGKATTPTKRSASPNAPRHLKWQELVPKDWDPGQQVRDRMKGQNVDALSDTDPRVLEMMREMRAVWDAAPTNPAMDGITGRLPGYVVPLDDSSQGMKEFLLVPYYGACIHSPPPPANQIVHVVSPRPVKDFQSMDTVWVSGTITVHRGDSYMGVSGYRIDATKIERYVRNPAQNDGR